MRCSPWPSGDSSRTIAKAGHIRSRTVAALRLRRSLGMPGGNKHRASKHRLHRAKEADQPMRSRAQRERSDRRRALRLLADTPEGVTEALMLAHGFRVALLVDLCIAGLAIARPEHMRAGGRTMEVVRHED